MGNCFGKADHKTQRCALNQWDDVTKCTVCGDWIQVHPNVRGANPNVPAKGKR